MRDPEQTVEHASAELSSHSDESLTPASIGRYRVEKVLGQGGFGLVYLARDDQLQRLVAIKVPHSRLVAQITDSEAYLTEARTVANLDHPHIVPVFDVGSSPDCPCFVVSKYIDGTDLDTRLKQSRLPLLESVELVATVAEALHHAHKRGLVHRDIKPGNILLDSSGKAFVGDFGLALREKEVGKGPQFAGTPAYMSPEQARGEGHRVDGRSDIFSLGVVFYKLLTGRWPFNADSVEELLEQISTTEARPPRQIEDAIPKELERICLKALSKRASDRFTTAQDMADDLRHYLAKRPDSITASTSAAPAQLDTAVDPIMPRSDSRPIQIVPKGLRSFDAQDADYFLGLLPGPRDRGGLPDSIRFWKTRIEEMDADNTFTVGLIYGPSGCGKSSLVKAGLLPRLATNAITLYVEATAEETETRLLNGLRKRCPALSNNLSLKETLMALRRGQGIPAGKKVLIVLDQFEQWLHAKKEEQNTELVEALRQCDGGRVQCIVMVRDDFWMAATRFMRELEVRLLEDQNSAAVDLFDLDHARRVLSAFGRAFGKLSENSSETGKEQKQFLNLAVAGLAQEGKVISVRLALFAEMMKGKTWTTATLKAVGGTEGVGATFLEETFSATTAPPEHRYHQKAAREVLKALLPESGTDIKGHMRSHEVLLEASGYARRQKDFDDLIRMLDGEIRLITPTDPEGKDDADASTIQAGAKYYQLTHDYLVPSLRDWLTRKQKETRRGRAELLLADRAGVWTARPENRQLPSMRQWLSIRWLTARNHWSPPQEKMMRKAARYHGMRGTVLACCLVLLVFAAWEGNGRLQARTLRNRLLEATTAEAPAVVKDMAPYRRWVDSLLKESYAQAKASGDARKQLHTSFALLPIDPAQADYLYERMLTGEPLELVMIREALLDHQFDLTGRLWAMLEDPKNDQDRRFRAACALAAFAPDDPRWEKTAPDVAATLVIQKPFAISPWTDALKRSARWLIPPLAGFLVDEHRSVSERGLIASVYGKFAAEVPDAYTRLEAQLEETGAADATIDAKIGLAKKKASVGAAFLVMGRGEKAWPLLKHAPDPTMRSTLIERLAPAGVDHKLLLARLDDEKDGSIKRALLLSLGEYGLDRLAPAERRNHLARMLDLYRDATDSGIHSAAGRLLSLWGAVAELMVIDTSLATGKTEGKRQWYINRQNQTMVMIAKPEEFWMGGRQRDETRHRRRIGRGFAISSKEVTVDQFRQFRKDHNYSKQFAPTGDCPVTEVSWYDAAAYCNWLSEQEGVAKDQWCYLPNESGEYAAGMKLAPDYLRRTGYRLPTEAEWEYACRSGTESEFSSGEDAELLNRYAWFDQNSFSKSHPAGSLKSNDFGLWDMHGNVLEWVQDSYQPHPAGGVGEALGDKEEMLLAISDNESRVLRGGSFNLPASLVRSSCRNFNVPSVRPNSGFRLSRTFTP